MISHGYRTAIRTLGRQILLEPVRWDCGRLARAVVTIRRRLRSMRRAGPSTRRDAGLRRQLLRPPTRPALGVPRSRTAAKSSRAPRGSRSPPARQGLLPDRHLASHHPHRRSLVRGRGGDPVEPDVEAGLSLLRRPLLLRMGIDGERMLSYSAASARTGASRRPPRIASRCASATTRTS